MTKSTSDTRKDTATSSGFGLRIIANEFITLNANTATRSSIMLICIICDMLNFFPSSKDFINLTVVPVLVMENARARIMATGWLNHSKNAK